MPQTIVHLDDGETQKIIRLKQRWGLNSKYETIKMMIQEFPEHHKKRK